MVCVFLPFNSFVNLRKKQNLLIRFIKQGFIPYGISGMVIYFFY